MAVRAPRTHTRSKRALTSLLGTCALLLVLCMPAWSLVKSANADTSTALVGKVDSYALSAGVSIDVFVPHDYSPDERTYPVMFVFDPQRYMLAPIAYQTSLSWKDHAPQMLVVGINMPAKQRRQFLDKQADTLIEALTSEIAPLLAEHYATNGQKLLFGWEKAAGFAIELLADAPDFIDAYFLASSTYVTKARLKHLSKRLCKKHRKSFVYLTLSTSEDWAEQEHIGLLEVFERAPKSKLEWRFDVIKDGSHYSTPLVAINSGLNSYFRHYPPLRFHSVAAFNDFGGVTALQAHYARRAKQYAVPDEIHRQTIHYLFNQAVNENDYAQFVKLSDAFEGFLENYGYRPNFIQKYARFYAENGNSRSAVALIESGVARYPQAQQLKLALEALQPGG